MHRDAIIPTASNVDSVRVPALREMVVVIRNHEDDADIKLPIAISKAARKVELASETVVAAENNEQSVVKTVRPARRARA